MAQAAQRLCSFLGWLLCGAGADGRNTIGRTGQRGSDLSRPCGPPAGPESRAAASRAVLMPLLQTLPSVHCVHLPQ